jgi:hypothetical protein
MLTRLSALLASLDTGLILLMIHGILPLEKGMVVASHPYVGRPQPIMVCDKGRGRADNVPAIRRQRCCFEGWREGRSRCERRYRLCTAVRTHAHPSTTKRMVKFGIVVRYQALRFDSKVV